MTITALDFIPAGASIQQLAFNAGQTTTATGTSFESWLNGQISELNNTLTKSDTMIAQLAAGQTDNLHQVMIGMEEAKLAFQLAVQVRNRVLEAYQDVLRMQI